MDVNGMRIAIKKLYSNDTWSRKVDKMKDNQVMAIYFTQLNKRR